MAAEAAAAAAPVAPNLGREARRRRLEALRGWFRAAREQEARGVLHVPARAWYVEPAVDRTAQQAVRDAAAELGLPVVPAVRWFREAGTGDREEDFPGEAFSSEPGLLGTVFTRDPHTIWLSAGAYARPGTRPEGVTPRLQRTIAHECQHVRDLLAGRGQHSVPVLEARARLVAARLVRGEEPGI